MTKTIPFEQFVRALDTQGIIFGGYVRDYLRGVQPNDIDVMVRDVLLTLSILADEFKVEVPPQVETNYGYGQHLKVRLCAPGTPAVMVDLVSGPVYLDYTVNGLTMAFSKGEPVIGLLAAGRVISDQSVGSPWENCTLVGVMADLAAKRLVPLRGQFSSGPNLGIRGGKMRKLGFTGPKYAEREDDRIRRLSDEEAEAGGFPGTTGGLAQRPRSNADSPTLGDLMNRPPHEDEDEIPF